MVESASNEKSGADASDKIYREWDTSDVSMWLKDSLKLPQYCTMFRKCLHLQANSVFFNLFIILCFVLEDIGVDGQIMDHITEVDL